MIEPFDIARDEPHLCSSEDEAKQLIKHYGKYLANKYLHEQYKYLIKESNEQTNNNE